MQHRHRLSDAFLRWLLENFLQALPGAENIAVILDTSSLEAFWLNECRREFEAFSTRVNFTCFNHMLFEEIKNRVAALPPNSAIFYGLLIMDAAGIPFHPGDALKAIIANANSAVFAMHESFLGLGISGGELIAALPPSSSPSSSWTITSRAGKSWLRRRPAR